VHPHPRRQNRYALRLGRAGVAPMPVWSGNTVGPVGMTRSGNRQLNAALHRIAVPQIRLNGLGRVYSGTA
jgi:transposase